MTAQHFCWPRWSWRQDSLDRYLYQNWGTETALVIGYWSLLVEDGDDDDDFSRYLYRCWGTQRAWESWRPAEILFLKKSLGWGEFDDHLLTMATMMMFLTIIQGLATQRPKTAKDAGFSWIPFSTLGFLIFFFSFTIYNFSLPFFHSKSKSTFIQIQKLFQESYWNQDQ